MKIWLCELKLLPAQQLFYSVILDERVRPDDFLLVHENKTIPLILATNENVLEIAERNIIHEATQVEVIHDCSDVYALLQCLETSSYLTDSAWEALSFLLDGLAGIDASDKFELRDSLGHLLVDSIETGLSGLSQIDRALAVQHVQAAVGIILMRARFLTNTIESDGE